MRETAKILSFDNELEARLLSGILEERNIPHILRSYHDSAYDGLWQTRSCWGHIEAPEEFRDEIMKIFGELSLPGSLCEEN